MANPISTRALNIGNRLVLGAKTFRRGLVSSLDFGKETIGRTAQKINSDSKKLKREEKRQVKLDEQIAETKDKKEKEKLIEAKKLKGSAGNLVRKTLTKPINALWKLIGGWLIANLPTILEEIRKFTKKVKIVIAAIKNAVKAVGGLFKSLVKIGDAFIKNLQEFDFNDSSGRIKEAKLELDEGMEEISTNFGEIKNVWGREESELDTILYELEEGSTMKAALDAIDKVDVDEEASTATEPQNSVVGANSSSGGAGGKWKKILDLIASAESVGGSYDSVYPNTTKPGLSKMTIEEADAWQARTAKERGSAAAGRYQFMNIKEQAVKWAGLSPSDTFSPENQDKMAIGLIEKKRKVTMDMVENNPVLAAKKLAMEWAGLPVMEATRGHKRNVTKGQSYYAGDGVNKSRVKPGDVANAFTQTLAPEEDKKSTQAPMPAGTASTELTNKVPFSDFSRTKAEGGGGTVGKTDGYNKRRGGGRVHKGIDIGTGGAYGWYVALKVDGTVSYVGEPDGLTSGAGRMVIIKDKKDKSREYVFMHLNKYSVTDGQKYKAGTPIGEIGNTGTSSGPHLHYEVRINNQHIDPGPYLKYIEIGRLKSKATSSATNTSGTAKERAAETSDAVASNRTGSDRVRTKTVVVKQQDIVMVT